MIEVAALYVDRRGPYARRPNVDAWFIDGYREHQTRLGWSESFHMHRDARRYDGPHPIVAHPPCGPWSSLKHLSSAGPEERSIAVRAVEQVRAFGGVLEHPAGSALWIDQDLPLPGRVPGETRDAFGGYSISVQQVEFGHVARKWTWLYLVGVPVSLTLGPPPFPGREPTHWVSGSRSSRSRQGSPVPLGIKVCSTQQRRRTPPLFADFLIGLAKQARRREVA